MSTLSMQCDIPNVYLSSLGQKYILCNRMSARRQNYLAQRNPTDSQVAVVRASLIPTQV